MNKEKYMKKEKSKCPNCKIKIVFHVTEIQYSS